MVETVNCMKTYSFLIVVLAIFSLTLISTTAECSRKKGGPPPAPVQVELVEERLIGREMALIGDVVAFTQGDVHTEVEGLVSEFDVKEGDFLKEGELIAKPGDPANEFYLIREGSVALLTEAPPRKPFIYQTLGANEIVGVAWLIPPYRWAVSAQAQSHIRAISIDGACLRKKCENDPSLGYKLMKHLVQLLVKREEMSRLHLLDVYGEK